MQTEHGMDAKDLPRPRPTSGGLTASSAAELDRYLAGEYGVDPEKPKLFRNGGRDHQPFHWLAEFYGIMNGGGFDVTMGNPPYFELKD